MNRTLLIARREYVAYAKTVGFWLSLLLVPLCDVSELPLDLRYFFFFSFFLFFPFFFGFTPRVFFPCVFAFFLEALPLLPRWL